MCVCVYTNMQILGVCKHTYASSLHTHTQAHQVKYALLLYVQVLSGCVRMHVRV